MEPSVLQIQIDVAVPPVVMRGRQEKQDMTTEGDVWKFKTFEREFIRVEERFHNSAFCCFFPGQNKAAVLVRK